MTIKENVSFKELTTFKAGGQARFLVIAEVDEVPEAVRFAEDKNLPIVPLGGGSNILAPEGLLNAVFLKISSQTISSSEEEDTITLTVEAGHDWDSVVSFAVRKGWWGFENLSGIPGTVGAAVVQNIGAYGVALEETFVAAEVYDVKEKKMRTFEKNDVRFNYRTSLFKEEPDRYIICSITFRLSTMPRPRIEYRDLKTHFESLGEEPAIETIRKAVLTIRQGKFPPLAEYGTAGSFFLNPVLPNEEALEIQSAFPGMPLFPMPEGGTKVPLAWILDHVLALKGMRVDEAFLWSEQPLVVAADSGVHTNAILTLADRVRDAVQEKTGIIIHPEVRILAREKKFQN